MDLAAHQRALLALVVGPTDTAPGPVGAAGDDAYLARVAASDALPVVRGIAASWRSFTLRRLCPLTWAVLDRRGLLADVLAELGRRPVSPFLRLLGAAFTDVAAEVAGGRGDDLAATVARFERSVVLPGPAGDRVVIDWPADPDVVLRRLLAGDDLDDVPLGAHRTTAPADDPTALMIEDRR